MTLPTVSYAETRHLPVDSCVYWQVRMRVWYMRDIVSRIIGVFLVWQEAFLLIRTPGLWYGKAEASTASGSLHHQKLASLLCLAKPLEEAVARAFDLDSQIFQFIARYVPDTL